ncbi:MAG: shikimate kinase [Elusimicrobiota bacterium]|jgi:shikimate kinase|nr:shikimate kinase [Elusimicrobiota bacterium]
MNFILTGFMGTGKTKTGQIIADKLKFQFIDTDSLVESKVKLSIGEIFENLGEKFFRELESEIIKDMSQKDRLVISCGGGAVLDFQNIKNLHKNGVIINLKATSETIFERLKDDNTRPLLKCQNPLEKIKELLSVRKLAYENCDLSFSTDFLTEAETAEIIIEKIKFLYLNLFESIK